MPHIVLLDEVIETLEGFSNRTEAMQALLDACEAANTYAHGTNPDAEILEAIEELAGSISGYLNAVNPPSDVRLQSYANQMQSILP